MTRLMLAYDPSGTLMPIPEETALKRGVRTACIDLAADLGDRDLYEVARRLAELLLEQAARDEALAATPVHGP